MSDPSSWNTPGNPPRMDLEVDIAPGLDAPAHARKAVAALRHCLDEDVLTDTTLLVSELVSNSVKYGVGRIQLTVRTQGARRVVVEVIDEGSGFSPHVRRPSRFASGGFGLRLVDELASAWGIADDAARVWFKIDRTADLVAAA
jgi:two-component sensor histidine kinase